MATQTELSRVSQELEESREETRRERASQAMLLKVETYSDKWRLCVHHVYLSCSIQEKETEIHSLRAKVNSEPVV